MPAWRKSEGPPTPNPRCACDRWAGTTNRFPAQDEAASTKRAARDAGECPPLAQETMRQAMRIPSVAERAAYNRGRVILTRSLEFWQSMTIDGWKR